jgi:predicted enzyme related to lactoylglutathione lyase
VRSGAARHYEGNDQIVPEAHRSLHSAKGPIREGIEMPASVGYLVIDSTDPVQLAPFWCALLNVQVDTTIGDGQFIVLSKAEDGLTVGFQQVPEVSQTVPKTKNKLHLDVRVGEDDVAAVVAKLRERGATFLWTGEQGPHTWVTLADPEGNEFCVSK